MNRTEVKTIDDLPELPFERLLSYLSLGDLIKSRAVSRGWYHRISCFKVKSLCCSESPKVFVRGRDRLAGGAFAQNFIGSPRFLAFFATFGSTILSGLKRLHVCEVDLKPKKARSLVQTINSFHQLEELIIIRVYSFTTLAPEMDFELNLPMLRRIHVKLVDKVNKLTLNSPRLKQVSMALCPRLNLVIVDGESVEQVLNDRWGNLPVKSLRNLKKLTIGPFGQIDSTFLSSLEQLREVELEDRHHLENLFEQKHRYGRTDLKIYRFGCLLSGPEDPLMSNAHFTDFNSAFIHLAKNRARLADELPLCRELLYSAIQPVDTQLAINLLKRCSNLEEITVDVPIWDIQRFLDLLKGLGTAVALSFYGFQPQDLFDRLPENYAVQQLIINSQPRYLDFLFRLKSLEFLTIDCELDLEVIRQFFEELPSLSSIQFRYLNNRIVMEAGHSNRFDVTVGEAWTKWPDLNAAIEFIAELVEVDSEDQEDDDEDDEEDDEELDSEEDEEDEDEDSEEDEDEDSEEDEDEDSEEDEEEDM